MSCQICADKAGFPNARLLKCNHETPATAADIIWLAEKIDAVFALLVANRHSPIKTEDAR